MNFILMEINYKNLSVKKDLGVDMVPRPLLNHHIKGNLEVKHPVVNTQTAF